MNTLYGLRTLELYRKCESQKDYIISVKYDRYAFPHHSLRLLRLLTPSFFERYGLGGRPFQINVFLGPVDVKDFYDSRSKNFVGSVFNFSGDVSDSQCSNCTKQQGDRVRSVSLLPATLAMNYAYHAKLQSGKDPEVSYVVINSQGRVSCSLSSHIRDTPALLNLSSVRVWGRC